mgnify:CR=1 FL=1
MLVARLSPASLALLVCAPASAQTFGLDFVADYSLTDLGTPTSTPGPLGGINFDPSDPGTVWVGGAANGSGGAIYEIDVMRDGSGHITSFLGSASFLATAPFIDGGLTFGPTGVMFVTGFPNNTLMQFLPGSTTPDRTDDLSTLGVNSSVGTCQFVPAGFAGAGTFKVGSYNFSDWYDFALVPDGSGTFDIASATATVNTGGGPEGIVYVAGGNPGFLNDSCLISEYSANAVRAYEIDANGDPIPSTRRDFLTGLTGAEGAVIDPVTGDFIFSTFGGGDRVLVVQGFSAPTIFCSGAPNSQGCTPTMTWTGSPTAAGPDDFTVQGIDLLNQAFGVLMVSTTPDSVPLGPGNLCLAGPMYRVPAVLSGGSLGAPGSDCSGAYSNPLTQAWFTQSGYTVGTTVYLQYISRDGGFGPPNNLSLSDGLRFTILP